MDSAHSGDRAPVAAKDIGSIEGWEDLKWYCLGCKIRVVPKACDPDENFDRVPHFARWPGEKHEPTCGIEGLDALIEKVRKKKPIKSTDQLLGTLPYNVKFSRSEPTGDPTPTDTGTAEGDGDPTGGPDTPKPVRFTRSSRTSINDICRAHAVFRDGDFRESLSLNVEGCLGSNYRDTFYQLQDIWRGDPLKLHGCIFYGELRFRVKPNYEDPEKLILTLNRGIRSTDGRTQPFYRVIIRWQEWGDQLRKLFVKDIEAKRLETNKRFDTPGRDKSERFISDINVYFLGQQLDGSPTDFEVDIFKKVAIIQEPNGIYEDRPTHSFLKGTPPRAEPPPPKRDIWNSPSSKPPEWVTSGLGAAVAPARVPEKPIVPPPPIPHPHPPARPVTPVLRQPALAIADQERPTESANKPPSAAQPSHRAPRNSRSPNLIEAAKEWFRSVFG